MTMIELAHYNLEDGPMDICSILNPDGLCCQNPAEFHATITRLLGPSQDGRETTHPCCAVCRERFRTKQAVPRYFAGRLYAA